MHKPAVIGEEEQTARVDIEPADGVQRAGEPQPRGQRRVSAQPVVHGLASKLVRVRCDQATRLVACQAVGCVVRTQLVRVHSACAARETSRRASAAGLFWQMTGMSLSMQSHDRGLLKTTTACPRRLVQRPPGNG
eukprot:6184412-Pleurochrysis_carterae.AAC.1